MKYLTVLTVLPVSLTTQAQATAQRPDNIIHDGVVYKLHTPIPNKHFPLESLWSDRKTTPNLSEGPGGSTGAGAGLQLAPPPPPGPSNRAHLSPPPKGGKPNCQLRQVAPTRMRYADSLARVGLTVLGK